MSTATGRTRHGLDGATVQAAFPVARPADRIRHLPCPEQIHLPLLDVQGMEGRLLVTAGAQVRVGSGLARFADGSVLTSPAGGVVRSIEVRPVAPPPRRPQLEAAPSVIIDVGKADGQEPAVIASLFGHGGAGFPLLAKMPQTLRHIVVNAVECDPSIACDRGLLWQRPDAVLAALARLHEHFTPQRLILASKQPLTLPPQLSQGLLLRRYIEHVTLAGTYPAGFEPYVLEQTLGIATGETQRPCDAGVLSINLGTAMTLVRCLDGAPPVQRIVTVTSRTVQRNFEVTLGTPARLLLRAAGIADDDVAGMRSGGALSGLPMPLDAPITQRINALHVLTRDDPPQPAMEPCIHCGWCADICPQNLAPQRLLEAARGLSAPTLAALDFDACMLCGACDRVCPSHIPLHAVFRDARTEQAGQMRRHRAAAAAQARFAARETRRTRREAERMARRNKRRTMDRKQVLDALLSRPDGKP